MGLAVAYLRSHHGARGWNDRLKKDLVFLFGIPKRGDEEHGDFDGGPRAPRQRSMVPKTRSQNLVVTPKFRFANL
jgi:hypothetical protein